MRVVRGEFLQKRRLELADLYDDPLTSFGYDFVDQCFSQEQVQELLDFTATLTVIGD